MHDLILTGEVERVELGGKARALARLLHADLPIPPWFVLAPQALTVSLTPNQQQQLALAPDAAAAQAVVAALTLAPAVQQALDAAVARLIGGDGLLAVRSSALDEDAAQHSFAGQLASVLNVTPAEVATAVLTVWRSGFSERVYAYRQEHDLPLPPPAPAVLIQQMVAAEVAGVAFSADPVSGERSVAVVSAAPGLGEALVSGAVDADTWRINRQGVVLETHCVDPAHPVLTAAQAQQVADLARQVERCAGRPQDIEWALAAGRLFLLQARPVTALAHLADPAGVFTLWDNSNIIESYGGVTTPLTYSFARQAYEAVYQEFCRLMGVPAAVIAANQPVFACMIGLIRGRIYYNLLNWYRLLALLPGFKVNRQFMDQMMGVKEPLPEAVLATLQSATWRQRLADLFYLVRTVLGLVANHFGLARRIRRFYARLRTALDAERPDLATLRADELVAYYRRLDRQLLTQWDAPLVNDFFAMIFYGLLRRLVLRWCDDPAGTLQNDLLTGEGGMISAEPAQRVRELAALAAADPALVTLLRTGEARAIQLALRQHPAVAQQVQAYLDRFGDRCQDELKLESATLHDDPLPLWRAVGRLAAQPEAAPSSAGERNRVRTQAESRVAAALAASPLRRWLFGWVLRQARARVRDRENLRFERTRVFGRARQIFLELGRRFYAADLLDAPRAVFYLNLDEILGFAEGTTTVTNLRAVAALRQAEFARYGELPAPAERFATLGMVHQANTFQGTAPRATPATPIPSASLTGLGCCPGLVRGRVRVVHNPLTANVEPGEILVAERTDPSWILILPAAAGLLVERGSLLSHAAIVAAKLGLPTIVSLTGVTQWLADGDWVEMDGGSGRVNKVNDAPANPEAAQHG